MSSYVFCVTAWSQFSSLFLISVLLLKRWPELSSPACLKGRLGRLLGAFVWVIKGRWSMRVGVVYMFPLPTSLLPSQLETLTQLMQQSPEILLQLGITPDLITAERTKRDALLKVKVPLPPLIEMRLSPGWDVVSLESINFE